MIKIAAASVYNKDGAARPPGGEAREVSVRRRRSRHRRSRWQRHPRRRRSRTLRPLSLAKIYPASRGASKPQCASIDTEKDRCRFIRAAKRLRAGRHDSSRSQLKTLKSMQVLHSRSDSTRARRSIVDRFPRTASDRMVERNLMVFTSRMCSGTKRQLWHSRAMSAASSSPHVCANRSVFSKMGAIDAFYAL